MPCDRLKDTGLEEPLLVTESCHRNFIVSVILSSSLEELEVDTWSGSGSGS